MSATPRLRRVTMRVEIARLTNIILMIAMTGCATSGPPPAAPVPAVAPVSFDGTYQGTIRVTTSAASGAQSNWCDTPPAISLSLQNGAFSYILAHPNVPQRLKLLPFSNLCGFYRSGRLLRFDKSKWRSRDDRRNCWVAHGGQDQWNGMQLRVHRRKDLSKRALRAGSPQYPIWRPPAPKINRCGCE